MRKLLGYRLKEEKYREAAFKIMDLSGSYEDQKQYVDDFIEDSYPHKLLDEAGVMHWFEEVYEEEFKVGDLVVTEIDHYLSRNTTQRIKEIKEDRIYIEDGGYWHINHARHATEEEKKRFNSLNGKTAIIDGVEYELKIK